MAANSANEEMVHWLGFACAERGWNCKRVRACCADGLVVDVYEVWHAVLPNVLQIAPDVVFNTMSSP